MQLRVDRDASASGTRVIAGPALIAPLEATVAVLDAQRIDRASLAIVPARTPHALELPVAGAAVVVTIVIEAADRAAAVREYAPHVEARRFSEVLAAPRVLPRTRWIDELIHRYVFERAVCEKPGSKAARFLEAELTKEIYFLGIEQIRAKTRASVVHEGDPIAVRARAWLEEHLFEPFAMAALVRACAASESTVLRAFRRAHGVAPIVYVRQRRLAEAMQLLESGRYAVTEVATRVGYETPSAFAAAFGKQFGVSPSSVRPTIDPSALLPAYGEEPTPRRSSARSATATHPRRTARGTPRRRRARASSSD
ncbi:MAG: helix-turn-helix transcriptional regulator [Deltaproteobacteria bacterium]|nr:helix-turn-helix transcriptional regulator [Deltaproteobacteria bacterium]